MNFTEMNQRVSLPAGMEFTDMDSGDTVRDLLDLPPYGVRILKK